MSGYELQEMKKHEGIIDGTVHDASRNFAYSLNEKYKNLLPRGSNKVILTEADFNVKNREDIEQRYFLTAASNTDEAKIHNIISNSPLFLSARFSPPINLSKS